MYGWYINYNETTTDSAPFYQHKDIYQPIPVRFEWDAPDEEEYFIVYISQNKDMNNADSYLVNDKFLIIDCLFTGTTYYWQIDAVYKEETIRSVIFEFSTADSPRTINIDGVSNTRDIGGLPAAEGYRIKQGMVYRGGKLEDITEAGKKFFIEEIGIKTDLDLRESGEGGAGKNSPLGTDINYINIKGPYYGGIAGESGKELFAKEIKVFANENNYPVYIHCSLGRDRTGTLAMVLEGLLGVDRNNIMMDYELSVFSMTGTLDNANIDNLKSNITSTYNYLNTFEGSDFSEKVENYLISIGVTKAEIQSIRSILLEEVK